jgi:CRISPR-associated endonuclease/helicase Cas3
MLLGKSNGTSLHVHTVDVINTARALKATALNEFPGEWWEGLFYAALLHDLGKIDPVFQAKLKHARDNGMEIPHGFLSLFFIKPERLPFAEDRIKHAVISAVAFHHWRESFTDLMMGNSSERVCAKAEQVFKNHTEWDGRVQELIEQLQEAAAEIGLDLDVIGINTSLVDYLQFNSMGGAGILTPPYTLSFLPEKLRKAATQKTDDERMRIFIAGNLIRADHFASLVEDNRFALELKDVETGSPITAEACDRALQEICRQKEYWQKTFFERKPGLKGKDLIFIAPTGFGKTEFSYVWGTGMKIINILPMRVAVNKIWERTVDLLNLTGANGRNSTALLHGNASLDRSAYEQRRGIYEGEGEQRQALEIARHLSKPYIIATADQIAPTALRYPGYERIFARMMDSSLVIDEVQAYDPKAAAIITYLIHQNSMLGGRTLLMTATLPPHIRNEIQKRLLLGEERIVRLMDEEEFRYIGESSRHKVEFIFHDGDFEEIAQKAVRAAEQGKKVLIVMNTVKAAVNVYERISMSAKEGAEYQTALFHSRFTAKHRQELESHIVDHMMPNKPGHEKIACIVVSTQVVEASLDIDADLLISELAPADSLIQRMGRVFRRYAREDGIHVSEAANVVIAVDKSVDSRGNQKKGFTKLFSGVGFVYDRELTVLSLIWLLLKMDAKNNDLDAEGFLVELQQEPWKSCFRKKNDQSESKVALNKILIECLDQFRDQSVILTESDKEKWVELCYGAIDKADSDSRYEINLGKYLKAYHDTLRTLDHGYCSDRKLDAQRLFRDVNDVSGIPDKMEKEFYERIYRWVEETSDQISYLQLAQDILPEFVVNCPYNSLRKEGTMHPLNREEMIPEGLNGKIREQVENRLERWLSGISVIRVDYDDKKGLLNFEQ